ncbi:hypothetical protein C8R45DRAFT_1115523 [Mycena sanguinolenta]|nr:hypothetical protein C8R45DRAFT_1115523 [Mycena sanguinolenta]
MLAPSHTVYTHPKLPPALYRLRPAAKTQLALKHTLALPADRNLFPCCMCLTTAAPERHRVPAIPGRRETRESRWQELRAVLPKTWVIDGARVGFGVHGILRGQWRALRPEVAQLRAVVRNAPQTPITELEACVQRLEEERPSLPWVHPASYEGLDTRRWAGTGKRWSHLLQHILRLDSEMDVDEGEGHRAGVASNYRPPLPPQHSTLSPWLPRGVPTCHRHPLPLSRSPGTSIPIHISPGPTLTTQLNASPSSASCAPAADASPCATPGSTSIRTHSRSRACWHHPLLVTPLRGIPARGPVIQLVLCNARGDASDARCSSPHLEVLHLFILTRFLSSESRGTSTQPAPLAPTHPPNHSSSYALAPPRSQAPDARPALAPDARRRLEVRRPRLERAPDARPYPQPHALATPASRNTAAPRARHRRLEVWPHRSSKSRDAYIRTRSPPAPRHPRLEVDSRHAAARRTRYLF